MRALAKAYKLALHRFGMAQLSLTDNEEKRQLFCSNDLATSFDDQTV